MADGAIEVVRTPRSSRYWVPLAGTVFTLVWAATEVSRGETPWTFALLIVWVGAALLGRIPVVIANEEGLRLRGRRMTPWSEVSEVKPAEDNGWQHQLPSVQLKDGLSIPFEPLTPEQLAAVNILLERSRGSPPESS